ncbi:MAG TPA: hypothetical protein VNR20_04800 [Terriglobales bacterium]|nr:hypothetical protein [Terriglobales bacterium]
MPEIPLRPGAAAPRTGAYTVTHRGHRLSHILFFDEQDVFPVCRKCGDAVRYELYMRIPRVETDRDLSRERQAAGKNVLPFRHPRVG